MTRELRELIEARNAEQAKLVAFGDLQTKSADELIELEPQIDAIEKAVKAIDIKIKAASAALPADGLDAFKQEKKEIKSVTVRHYWDAPEYKDAFFAVLSGEETKEQAEMLEKALTTGNNGAVIPTTTFQTIIRKLEQTNLLFPLVRKTFVRGNLNMPAEDASEDAVWGTAEGTAVGEEALTTKTISFTNHELNKLVSVSKKLLNEGIDDVEAFVIDEIVRKFGVAIDKAIAVGTGSSQPTGLLVDATVTQTSNIDLSTLDSTAYDAFQDWVAELPSSYEPGAVMVMHKKTFNLFKKIKDNDGRPIFTETRMQGGGVMRNLDGWPVALSDYMPTYAAASEDAPFAIFGNMFYYNMNISKEFELDFSMDSKFRERLVDYLGTMYADGKVTQPEGFVKLVKNETP